MLGIRGVLLRLVGLAGNVALARLLLPRDFGAVAFGTSLMVSVTLLAGTGLGAGLIRRKEPPSKEDLEALVAIQLIATSSLALLVAAIAWPFGIAGRVTALMVSVVPLAAFRTPGAILLERELSYRTLVLVELSEQLAFYGWAVGTVASGWGVWGFATAAFPRAVAGAVMMLKVGPIGLLRPRFSWTRVKHLVSFGIQYQSVGLASLGRDQVLNVGTAAISGIGILGLWNLASRVLQIPFVLFESLWRVSFPAVSRLLARGGDIQVLLERGVGLSAVGTGAVLVALVGAGPGLVPVVFGSQWRDAAGIVPWAALGLMVAGPVSVNASGYLYAVGDAASVLRGVLLHSAVWAAIAFALLPSIGVTALGVGWFAGGLVEAFALGYPTTKRSGARIASAMIVPILAAVTGGTVSWFGVSFLSAGGTSVILGTVAAETLYLAILVFLRRSLLFDAVRLGARAMRLALRPSVS